MKRILTLGLLCISLTACATMPEVREIEGPIEVDAPDAVVTSSGNSPATPAPSANPGYSADLEEETVQSVPITPVDCPAGTTPAADGSCLLTN